MSRRRAWFGLAGLTAIAAPSRRPAPKPAPVPKPPEPVARAPWVPREQPVSALNGAQAAKAKSAFERDRHCPVCAYRYSRCYCGTGDER